MTSKRVTSLDVLCKFETRLSTFIFMLCHWRHCGTALRAHTHTNVLTSEHHRVHRCLEKFGLLNLCIFIGARVFLVRVSPPRQLYSHAPVRFGYIITHQHQSVSKRRAEKA